VLGWLVLAEWDGADLAGADFAGAAGFDGALVFFCAEAKTGAAAIRATKTHFRRALSHIAKFIADS
jgi:hypothetical protein